MILNEGRAALFAAVVVTLCLSAPSHAHTYFVSDFETGDGESIAVLNSYTHDGEWVWMLNSTSPLASAEFVDRKGSALEPTFNPIVDLVLQSDPTDLDGTLMYNGSFASSDLKPGVAYLFKTDEKVDELSGHVCMGHIYARVNTTDGGSVVAPLSYNDRGKGKTCEEATGSGGHSMMPGMDMGGLPEPGVEMAQAANAAVSLMLGLPGLASLLVGYSFA